MTAPDEYGLDLDASGFVVPCASPEAWRELAAVGVEFERARSVQLMRRGESGWETVRSWSVQGERLVLEK